MPKQLPEVAFGRCGHPDPRKALGEQEIQNEPGVALIGLLSAQLTGANLCGVSDPQFMTEFREQTLEPVNRASGFDAHVHRFLQTAVERMSSAALVVQSPLEKQLTGLVVGHGNLLIACVKITTYNQHPSAPLFLALVVEQLPSLLVRRSRRRHLIRLVRQPCNSTLRKPIPAS